MSAAVHRPSTRCSFWTVRLIQQHLRGRRTEWEWTGGGGGGGGTVLRPPHSVTLSFCLHGTSLRLTLRIHCTLQETWLEIIHVLHQKDVPVTWFCSAEQGHVGTLEHLVIRSGLQLQPLDLHLLTSSIQQGGHNASQVQSPQKPGQHLVLSPQCVKLLVIWCRLHFQLDAESLQVVDESETQSVVFLPKLNQTVHHVTRLKRNTCLLDIILWHHTVAPQRCTSSSGWPIDHVLPLQQLTDKLSLNTREWFELLPIFSVIIPDCGAFVHKVEPLDHSVFFMLRPSLLRSMFSLFYSASLDEVIHPESYFYSLPS